MASSEDDENELFCKKCKKSITDDNYITCDGLCKSVFHVECSDIKKSFLKFIKSSNSIKWLCEVCNEYTTNQGILTSIENVVNNLLNQKFSELYMKLEQERKNMHESIINSINNSSPKIASYPANVSPTKKHPDKINEQNIESFYGGDSRQQKSANISYSTVVKSKKVHPTNSLFIKARDKDQSPAELCKQIKSSVNPARLSIAVNRIRTTNSGVIINCEDTESLNKLKDTLTPQLENQCELKTSKSITPKIIIYSSEKSDEPIEDVTLANDIINANKIPSNAENFMFKIVRKINHNGLVNLIVAVDSKTRTFILSLGHLYVNWSRCRIAESYHIKRCNTCCNFGHLSTNCNSKFPVCNLCAESHESKLCSSNFKKCANCIQSNRNYKTEHDINHSAKDNTCPCYLNKLNSLKNQTLESLNSV